MKKIGRISPAERFPKKGTINSVRESLADLKHATTSAIQKWLFERKIFYI